MTGSSPPPAAPTTYRMTPALVVTTVGRGLVTLGTLVVLTTLLDLVVGSGVGLVVPVAVVGLAVIGLRAWWLLRRWMLKLSVDGYAVRGLHGVGVRRAAWSEVESAVAADSSGTPCLLVRLGDGRSTVLPMAAFVGDREVVAGDVQRRLRDAHTSGRTAQDSGADPDSVPTDDSL